MSPKRNGAPQAAEKTHVKMEVSRKKEHAGSPVGTLGSRGEHAGNWQVLALGDIAEVKLGKMLDKAKHVSGARRPYLRNINVRWGTINTSDLLEMRFEVGELERFGLRKNDVLVCEGGEPGRAAVWDGRIEGLMFQKALHRVRFKQPYDPRLLTYYLELLAQTGGLERRFTGSTIKHFTREAFVRLPIPVPPVPEQPRIVAEIERYVTGLDVAASSLRRVQANLKRYRAAVLKAACEGRLVPTEAELVRQAGRPGDLESGEALLARILEERRRRWKGRGKYKEPMRPDESQLPVLPEGWGWATLDAVAELVGGITKDQKRKLTTPARAVPYLRVANVQRGYLDLEVVKEIVATEAEIEELALRPGDILFNEGGDRDKLGRGWIWSGELPECIHQNHVFRARLYGTGMSPKFLSWYANTFGQKFFFDKGKHTTNLASISMSKLRLLPLPVPPRDEQERIVGEVERRLSVVEELEAVVEANIQRASGLRQAILRRAFTGETTTHHD